MNRNEHYRNYRSDGPGPIELVAHSHSYKGFGTSGYKRSDNSIEEEVCELLMHTVGLDVEDVFISVTNGIIKLSGSVKSRQEKFIIEDIAEHVSGVIEIENHIRVLKNPLPDSDYWSFKNQID